MREKFTEDANSNSSKSNGIRYSYCLDENNELIHIGDVTRENCKVHTYKCLCCGQKMNLRWGQVRKKHFSHNPNTICNNESYLHKLAKIRIKEQFDFNHKLLVCFRNDASCSEGNECKMFDNSSCHQEVNEPFDLCQMYDTCEIEKRIDGVVADLLLTNSNDPDINPLLIEVYVNHSCDEEKINKGLQIFETPLILSEEDVDNIIKHGITTCSPALHNDSKEGIGYNIIFNQHKHRFVRQITRFILSPNCKINITSLPCDKRMNTYSNSSWLELNVNNRQLLAKEFSEEKLPDAKIIGLLYAARHQFGSRICPLCKFMENYCLMATKGAPMYPANTHAGQCTLFRLTDFFYDISEENLNGCVEEIKEVEFNKKRCKYFYNKVH